MTEPRNIVQAEFFHVGGEKVQSLSQLLAECGERIKDGFELAAAGHPPDGSGIKTTVRFYDDSNVVTNAVLKYASMQNRHEALLCLAFRTKGLCRSVVDFRRRRLSRKITLERKYHKTLAIRQLRTKTVVFKQLKAFVDTTQEIGIERPDRSFRPARRDELHDLLEAADSATYVWLFVFRPNNLFADKNMSVAYAM